MKNVTQEQIDTMLGFRLKDLKRLDEGALRKKIQGIVGDIAAVDRDLQRPMAVVVRHLRQISADYGDARRTRTSGRLQDERKM
jgi:DNA gyrase/topoisomerase IV subunit A